MIPFHAALYPDELNMLVPIAIHILPSYEYAKVFSTLLLKNEPSPIHIIPFHAIFLQLPENIWVVTESLPLVQSIPLYEYPKLPLMVLFISYCPHTIHIVPLNTTELYV